MAQHGDMHPRHPNKRAHHPAPRPMQMTTKSTMRTHAAHAREARYRDRIVRVQHPVLKLSKSELLTAQQRQVWQFTCLGHHAVDLQ